MVIRVLDHVPQCSSYADGEVIFNLIAPYIEQHETVTLSFDGVLAVPSSFVNAALVQLVERVTLDEVKKHLRITDSTREINQLLRTRFEYLATLSGSASHPN